MKNKRLALIIFMIVLYSAGLHSRMPIEVFVHKPNAASRAILNALQGKIRQDSRFTLVNDYASSDMESIKIGNETIHFIEEALDDFDFLLLLNARDVSTQNTSQVVVAMDMIIQGVLFDTDIFLATDLSYSQIADMLFQNLDSYAGLSSLYQNQAMNTNRQAVASDLSNYMAEILQYWLTPISQGGAGQDLSKLTPSLISERLGFNVRNGQVTENGRYTILSVNKYTVKIQGTMNVANEQGVFGTLTGSVDCKTRTTNIENN